MVQCGCERRAQILFQNAEIMPVHKYRGLKKERTSMDEIANRFIAEIYYTYYPTC